MPNRPFGFTVEVIRKRYDPAIGDWCQLDPPEWRVYLPHQCQTWDVAGDDSDYGDPQEVAVAELERFIAEAQQALVALRAGQEVGKLEGD
jgi:hypothetical protein